MTTIWGKSRLVDWPRAPRTSWSLEAMGISSSIVAVGFGLIVSSVKSSI